jgi:hypothetical protein
MSFSSFQRTVGQNRSCMGWVPVGGGMLQGKNGRGEIKENAGGGESSNILFDNCKIFCDCHNVPPPSTIKK